MRYGIDLFEDRWRVVDENGNVLAVYEHAAEALADVGRRLAAEETAPASSGRFRAMLVPEGTMTSDQRMIEEGACTWRVPPLPFMLQTETEPGHMGAELAGRFDRIVRQGHEVWGYGDLDDSDAGRRAREILDQHGRYGISVDLGAMDAEIVCDDEEDYDTCSLIVHAGEIMGATGTPFPAFAESFIELDAETNEDAAAAASVDSDCVGCEQEALVAGLTQRPPRAWFEAPEFDRLTPLHVEGRRVFGHLAGWSTCHTGRPDVCVTAPRSSSGYPYFRTGVITVDDGTDVPVGQITLGTGHAPTSLSFRAAAEHYDHTGTAVADVAAGEDDYGIWVAGVLCPSVDEETVQRLRAASISGDWRVIAGRHELVAALAVNVPGFPIPRVAAGLAASGYGQIALVAAGIVTQLEPWEEQMQELRAEIAEIRTLAQTTEQRTRPLRKLSALHLQERVARDERDTVTN